jgi:cytoskeleton protein RodZ
VTDFGGKLRTARERRGISLRQIAASTKISAAALEALERNDISKLPGGIFSRAFVRSYALEVGLDPDETVREFVDRFQGEPAPSAPVPVAIPESESNFESQQRMASVVLKLVLVSVPLIVLILYLSYRYRSSSPGSSSESTPPAASATIGTPVAAKPEVPAPSATAVPSTGQLPPIETPAAAANGTLKLAIQLSGDCWVRVTVDGRQMLERVMKAGENQSFDVRDLAVLDVGNAGAFTFSLDGRPAKPLGLAGDVKSVRITRDTVAQLLK